MMIKTGKLSNCARVIFFSPSDFLDFLRVLAPCPPRIFIQFFVCSFDYQQKFI